MADGAGRLLDVPRARLLRAWYRSSVIMAHRAVLLGRVVLGGLGDGAVLHLPRGVAHLALAQAPAQLLIGRLEL
eukprot:4604394-Pleurochrysis_carterae.AAC.2